MKLFVLFLISFVWAEVDQIKRAKQLMAFLEEELSAMDVKLNEKEVGDPSGVFSGSVRNFVSTASKSNLQSGNDGTDSGPGLMNFLASRTKKEEEEEEEKQKEKKNNENEISWSNRNPADQGYQPNEHNKYIVQNNEAFLANNGEVSSRFVGGFAQGKNNALQDNSNKEAFVAESNTEGHSSLFYTFKVFALVCCFGGVGYAVGQYRKRKLIGEALIIEV